MEQHSRPRNKRYARSPFEVVDGRTIMDAIKNLKDKLEGLVTDYDIEGARRCVGEFDQLSTIYSVDFGNVEDEILLVQDEIEKKCTAARTVYDGAV